MIDKDRFQKAFLLLLVLGISLLFLAMIRRFLMPVFMAAIFSGLSYPLYRRITGLIGERPSVGAVLTLLVVMLGIVIPLGFFGGIVTDQAIQITSRAGPFIQNELARTSNLAALVDRFPVLGGLVPYQDLILARVGAIAGGVGGFLVDSLASATQGAVAFIFAFFIMLYAMFFFLRDGTRILDRILYLLPLDQAAEKRMVDRFVSVTRATVKGTLVIGLVQGALAGGALALAGIHGAAFWATVMAVLSIIPGVGTALVWVPAVLYLAATGHYAASILVAVWCVLVVGSADNFLRPALVGRDTEMSDLLILLSTLGGLLLFGAAGIVVGPIVAALFVTVWDLYAGAFAEYLPSTRAELLT